MATKKKTGPKPKIGTKLDLNHICTTIYELMSVGASITEVAAELGIARSTFYEWRDEYPEIADTLKRAEELSAAWWEKMGRTHLAVREFNAALWYMNMKNRFKWSDRIEQSGSMTIRHEDAIEQLA
jgi:hypothetical protein